MKKCSEMEAGLILYMDGRLDREREKETEKHLEECSSCRALLKDYRELKENLSGLKTPRLSAGFWDEFSEKLKKTEIARPGYYRFRFSVAAGLLILFGACGLFIFHNGRRDRGSFALKTEKPEKEPAAVIEKSRPAAPAELPHPLPGTKKKNAVRIIQLARLPQDAEELKLVFRGSASCRKITVLKGWRKEGPFRPEEKGFVIGAPEEWARAWSGYFEGSAPDVDFSDKRVIGVYSLRGASISKVRASGRKYYIEAEEGPGSAGTELHLLLIEKNPVE